ncbi:ATP-binding protein [Streptomyces sp. WAC07149]|uniref:ATP-binding protein n=1 Tax=Streptomyces sp. WAC07149 TaxID=2487425 RepID=UPI000F787544|nr:ATP-binding protein [Streptomyces sp. WAC07149]RST02938.1 ATP-binding protein [Streptomyces sp. WAC07149]
MSGCPTAGPRSRCVLPFAAESAELRLLRNVVRDQLVVWGLPALADDALLAVTELTSNVIKHVGAGTSATLVLEPDPTEGRLRVEVHDKSRSVPAMAQVPCDEESGRGLSMLAVLAVDWGTVLTATGKAVWCELALQPDRLCRRVQRGAAVLEAYRRLSDDQYPPTVWRRQAAGESVTDLIADVLHWLAAQGCDPDDILDRAQTHYEAEAKAA